VVEVEPDFFEEMVADADAMAAELERELDGGY